MVTHIEKTFRKGSVIIREGQPGSTFYVILEGMVEVLKRHGDRDIVITALGPNEFFGEMSLLDPATDKRSATVRAVENTKVAIMSKEAFEQYMGQLSPGVRNLLRRLSERLRKTDDMVESPKTVRGETIVDQTFDFSLTLDELEQAREHSVDIKFLNKKFSAGQTILREGDKGQCGFIVRKGRLEVSRKVKGKKIILTELGENDIMGESALFDDTKRSATVTALTDGELMLFGKRDMLRMARKSPLELFLIVDSLSAKLDRTNEAYCNTLIEVDSLNKQVAKLNENLASLNCSLEESREENKRLKESVAKLQSTGIKTQEE